MKPLSKHQLFYKRLQELRKSKNLPYQLAKLLRERNKALVNSICAELDRTSVLAMLKTAWHQFQKQPSKPTLAGEFLSHVKATVGNQDPDKSRRMFSKTAQQKQNREQAKKKKRQLQKLGIEKVGEPEPKKGYEQEEQEEREDEKEGGQEKEHNAMEVE